MKFHVLTIETFTDARGQVTKQSDCALFPNVCCCTCFPEDIEKARKIRLGVGKTTSKSYCGRNYWTSTNYVLM